MAGRWSSSPRKLTLTGSSSGSTRQCPFCHVPLVKIQSKQPTTKGDWFLKCPYNIKDGDTRCGFIRNEKEYETLEAAERQLQAGKSVSSDCYAELKEDLEEMKKTLASVVVELWKLKAKGDSKQIVLYFSVFMGFVGVLIGVVVACMWK